MFVRVRRYYGDEIKDAQTEELLDFLRGTVNRRGEPKTDVEVFFGMALDVRANKETDAGVAWTFSTYDLDRYEERVDPAGWDLAGYLLNPVVQWAHAYDIPAIGRSDDVVRDERGLRGRIVFNDQDYDPFGWAIGERVKRGILRAGSVGFRVLEVELPGKEEAEDGTSLIFRRQELLEFSICNVPANPFALAGGKVATEGRNATEVPFWGNLIQGRVA